MWLNTKLAAAYKRRRRRFILSPYLRQLLPFGDGFSFRLKDAKVTIHVAQEHKPRHLAAMIHEAVVFGAGSLFATSSVSDE